MDHPLLDAFVAELQRDHGCHTVVLYGSRARGDWTAASDYDLLGVRDDGPTYRVARQEPGGYLDGFVYGAPDLAEPGEDRLYMRGGRVLVQRDGWGDRFLAALDVVWSRPPAPWAADDREASRVWAAKTLARVARGDVEADYRRVMLLHDTLGDWFRARGKRFEGPKAALAWLAAHEPAAFALVAAALKPGAPPDALAAWCAEVWR